MKEIVIRCIDIAYAEKVQNKLFELGCEWLESGKNIFHPNGGNGYNIWVANGIMKWTAERDYPLDLPECCIQYELNGDKLTPTETLLQVRHRISALSKFKEMKIVTDNQVLCEKVQEKLFSLGYRWKIGGKEIQHWGAYSLFTDVNGLIQFHQLKYDHDADTTPEYIFDETSGNFTIKSN